MNPNCPVCNYRFMREQGYFLGAMMLSYPLSVLVAAPPAIALYLLHASMPVILAVAAVQLVACSPWLFRYSRGIWMHIDYLIDPQ